MTTKKQEGLSASDNAIFKQEWLHAIVKYQQRSQQLDMNICGSPIVPRTLHAKLRTVSTGLVSVRPYPTTTGTPTACGSVKACDAQLGD